MRSILPKEKSREGASVIKVILEAIRDFFFPSVCYVCDRDALNPPLCEECSAEIHVIERNFCQLCGQPIPKSSHSPLCSDCVKRPLSLGRIRAWARYTYPLDKLVQAFKYSRRKRLGEFFSRKLAGLVRSDPMLGSADMIVPVPLHLLKRWWRSYNQSAVLARALSEETGIRFEDILRRNRMTRTQTKLSPEARQRNVEGAFSIRKGVDKETFRGRKAILLDDVITSGSTLDAAAGVLLDEGATEVYGLVIGGAWRGR